MNASGYFKTSALPAGAHPVEACHPFDGTDLRSVRFAFVAASCAASLHGGEVAVYGAPEDPGPWDGLPTVGDLEREDPFVVRAYTPRAPCRPRVSSAGAALAAARGRLELLRGGRAA